MNTTTLPTLRKKRQKRGTKQPMNMTPKSPPSSPTSTNGLMHSQQSLPDFDLLSTNLQPDLAAMTTNGEKKPRQNQRIGISGGRVAAKYTKLEIQLTESIAAIGMLLYVLPATTADGLVVVQHAQPLAAKLVNCAKDNEGFYKILVFIVTSSTYGALAAEMLAIMSAIMANHGLSLLPGADNANDNAGDTFSTIPDVP